MTYLSINQSSRDAPKRQLNECHQHEKHELGGHFGIHSRCSHSLESGYGNQRETGHQLCIEGAIESSIGFPHQSAKKTRVVLVTVHTKLT